MMVVVLLAAALAKAESPPATPPAPQAKVERGADGWRVDLTLDRPLFGWALPRAQDGKRTVFLLAGPQREPKEKLAAAPCDERKPDEAGARDAQLYRWRSESPEQLELLISRLPQGSLDAIDLDGDGNEDLILERKSGIDRMVRREEGGASVEPLIEDGDLAASHGGPRIAWDTDAAGDGRLRVALLGGFRTYGAGSSGAWTLLSELAVPRRVDAGPELFRFARHRSKRSDGPAKTVWCSRPSPSRWESAGSARSSSIPTAPPSAGSSRAGPCSPSPSASWIANSRSFAERRS